MSRLEKQFEFLDETPEQQVKTAVLLVGHGSRARNANDALFRVVDHFQKAWPHRILQAAFLEISNPSIPDGIDSCVAEGSERIIVIPYFLFRGNHVAVDLPVFIQEGRKKYPEIDVILGPHLGFHPKMIEIVDERIQQVLNTLKPNENTPP